MSEDKNSQVNSNEWVTKLQDMFQSAQGELKKATKLGSRLITASQSSGDLKSEYEKLGRACYQAAKEKKNVDLSSDEIKKNMETITSLEKQLEDIENEVQSIKSES